MKNVLIVTSNTYEINSEIPTGVWYEEFAIPYLGFLTQKYDITVASPKGGKSPVDPKSLNSAESQNVMQALENTEKLSKFSQHKFDCIFIPGGHACMFDLPFNQDLVTILENNRDNLITAVCHGVCGLINSMDFIKNKKLTAFSDAEEAQTGLEKYMPFLLEDKLKELGAIYLKKSPWSIFTVEDKNLITGQNQNSVEELTAKIIKKLN